MESNMESLQKLTKDLKLAAKTLTAREVRFLVDYYYIAQEDRKRGGNQVRSLTKTGEPSSVIGWLTLQTSTLEEEIRKALDVYTQSHIMGGWAREVYGIGPVISAGLLAHINIEKAPTVGHIWRFAGLDPTTSWSKGEIRPWNARLKSLCWKIGQSFMKFSNRDDCFYGHVYKQRKEYEVSRNESGANRELAISIAESGRFGKTTDAYKSYSSGLLPPAQLDARARRYAVKLFLSHLHGEWYQRHFNTPPPLPYAIAHLNHAHFIPPPH